MNNQVFSKEKLENRKNGIITNVKRIYEQNKKGIYVSIGGVIGLFVVIILCLSIHFIKKLQGFFTSLQQIIISLLYQNASAKPLHHNMKNL